MPFHFQSLIEPPKASISSDDLEFLLMPNIGEEVKTSVSSVGVLLASLRRPRRLSVPQLSKNLQIKHDELECIEQTTSGMTLLNYIIYANYIGVSLRYLFSAAYSEDISQWQSPEEQYIRLVKGAIPCLEELSSPVKLCTVSQLTGVHVNALGHYLRVKALIAEYKETYYAAKTHQFMLREEESVKRVQEARDELLVLGKAITLRNIISVTSLACGVPA